jgi:hypothetical protein
MSQHGRVCWFAACACRNVVRQRVSLGSARTEKIHGRRHPTICRPFTRSGLKRERRSDPREARATPVVRAGAGRALPLTHLYRRKALGDEILGQLRRNVVRLAVVVVVERHAVDNTSRRPGDPNPHTKTNSKPSAMDTTKVHLNGCPRGDQVSRGGHSAPKSS